MNDSTYKIASAETDSKLEAIVNWLIECGYELAGDAFSHLGLVKQPMVKRFESEPVNLGRTHFQPKSEAHFEPPVNAAKAIEN